MDTFLWARYPCTPSRGGVRADARLLQDGIQGFLAHEKPPPPRTLHCTVGPCLGPHGGPEGGNVFSCERGTPVQLQDGIPSTNHAPRTPSLRETVRSAQPTTHHVSMHDMQGNLAHQKRPLPRTSIGPWAWSYCRVLRDGVFYEQGTPVENRQRSASNGKRGGGGSVIRGTGVPHLQESAPPRNLP